MKEWFTAREIADLAFPGMPKTESGILRMAERESWSASPRLARPRMGRGGGHEFNIRVLPTVELVHLLLAQASGVQQ